MYTEKATFRFSRIHETTAEEERELVRGSSEK